jgi:hypothetical protein
MLWLQLLFYQLMRLYMLLQPADKAPPASTTYVVAAAAFLSADAAAYASSTS